VPVRNFDVFVDGRRYEIDLAYPDCLGAIEADSRRFHATATQKRKDRERQDALEGVGYRFRRFTWTDVFGRPDWIVEQVRELVACAEIQPVARKMRNRGA
jgi:very-short-patch-repair endonuclease